MHRLGGQLRVESKVNEGSRFSFLIPLSLSGDGDALVLSSPGSSRKSLSSLESNRSRKASFASLDSAASEIDSLVEALSSSHMVSSSPQGSSHMRTRSPSPAPPSLPMSAMKPGVFGVSDSSVPLRPVKLDGFDVVDTPISTPGETDIYAFPSALPTPTEIYPPTSSLAITSGDDLHQLRVLIVEVGSHTSQVPRSCSTASRITTLIGRYWRSGYVLTVILWSTQRTGKKGWIGSPQTGLSMPSLWTYSKSSSFLYGVL